MKQVLIKKTNMSTLLLYSQEYGATRSSLNLDASNTVVAIGKGIISTTNSTITFNPSLPSMANLNASVVGLASTTVVTSYPKEIIGKSYYGSFDASGHIFTSSSSLPAEINDKTGDFGVVLSNSVNLINISDIEWMYNKQYLLLVNDVYDDRLEYYDNTIVPTGRIDFHRGRKILHFWNTGANNITVYLTDPTLSNISSSSSYPTYFILPPNSEFELNSTLVNWQTAFISIWISGTSPSYRLIAY